MIGLRMRDEKNSVNFFFHCCGADFNANINKIHVQMGNWFIIFGQQLY